MNLETRALRMLEARTRRVLTVARLIRCRPLIDALEHQAAQLAQAANAAA